MSGLIIMDSYPLLVLLHRCVTPEVPELVKVKNLIVVA